MTRAVVLACKVKTSLVLSEERWQLFLLFTKHRSVIACVFIEVFPLRLKRSMSHVEVVAARGMMSTCSKGSFRRWFLPLIPDQGEPTSHKHKIL